MIGFGRLYLIEFHAVSVSAQQDFFYVKPAVDKICFIEEVKLGNVGGTADAGDAQEEMLSVEFVYLPSTVTAGSGGGSFTPLNIPINDAAAGFTARINDTTKASTSGTASNRDSDSWNVRIPYLWQPAPEHRLIVANAAAIVFRLNTTPADAITCNGSMKVRELP